jgi:hypothetical protein
MLAIPGNKKNRAIAYFCTLSVAIAGCGGIANTAGDKFSPQLSDITSSTSTVAKIASLDQSPVISTDTQTKSAVQTASAAEAQVSTENTLINNATSNPSNPSIIPTVVVDSTKVATTPKLINIPPKDYGTTYYVRTDGGDSTKCNGKFNIALTDASGMNCAWSHISYALPSGGAARISGGDTLVIGNGTYMIGYGMPGTNGCSTSYPYDCKLLSIPSGVSPTQPTRIVGSEFANGCKTKPQLWGTERVSSILDLNNSNNVEIQCLEITDHSNCNGWGAAYSDPTLYCRNTANYPNGTYGDVGIVASNSSNVLLQNLDIHGMAYYGVNAAGLTNWTMNYVRLALNGGGGWGGTYGSFTQMYGTTTMSNMIVEWNGCSDNYPYSDTPYACADQNGAGYGDGIGLDRTGGDFIITDSIFRNNIQDGLDMLYHTEGGSVIINRVWAEGNMGNQLKVGGAVILTNSIAVGNCSFIAKKANIPHPSPSTGLMPCRAVGDTIALALIDRSSGTNKGTTGYLVNNTITGGGNVMVVAGTTFGTTTNPSLYMINNIMLGNDQNSSYAYPGDTAAYYDATTDIPTLPIILTALNNIVNTTRTSSSCLPGQSNICKPGIYPSTSIVSNPNPNSFDPRLKPGSIAVNSGITGVNVPPGDFLNISRPQGPSIDIGALELLQ